MDAAISKQLVDKIYEKRKAGALELEKHIRECNQQGKQQRISQVIDQLIEMFSNHTNPMHVRNGGLTGLAGTAIALGIDIAPYMDKFIPPLLSCFIETESRIRFFAMECLYNICKVCKGEVLVYFNDIFDACSKLCTDADVSVQNATELLDRLLKDIVAEVASVYVPIHPETARIRYEQDKKPHIGVLVSVFDGSEEGPRKAFSLPHFIPLLKERLYVVSPLSRAFMLGWIGTLSHVPELEIISYLPEFLDALLSYLTDPDDQLRMSVTDLLFELFDELRHVCIINRGEGNWSRGTSFGFWDVPPASDSDSDSEAELPDDWANGEWHPGQGVRVDFPAIINILLRHLDGKHEEIQQSTALEWIAGFTSFAWEFMVPFAPRLIQAILPNLAHHAEMIRTSALQANKLLFQVIEHHLALKHEPNQVPFSKLPPPSFKGAPASLPNAGATPTATGPTRHQSNLSKEITRDLSSPDLVLSEPLSPPPAQRARSGTIPDQSSTPRPPLVNEPQNGVVDAVRSESPSTSIRSQGAASSNAPNGDATDKASPQEAPDPLDYQATVNSLTVQLISEFEETRISTLRWLIMLHQKAPQKISAVHDGTFPALLKTLSDDSEEVIKYDLQLLAQMSSGPEEAYFKVFMVNLLELFSTDRRLLETRGSLIIRQLCSNLSTEKIYRTFSEILEKEEDLEFASVMVQKLNIILITSPELAEFRRRLKTLETRQDGQALFTTLYRCWCHNAVTVFSLCLLAQAYEHASNLLYIFADLEITVPMLVQVDKLVQLIESPVFTYLRLQLLEPDRYPYLFKCLYGLLMLLPQSSAFVSLRNRLNAVNSAGFLHIAPKPNLASMSRSKIGREEIKWQDLLQHFRAVQSKHEKARRQAHGLDHSPFPEFDKASENSGPGDKGVKAGGRIPMRRRVTGGDLSAPSAPMVPSVIPSRTGALSPLNPKRTGTALSGSSGSGSVGPALTAAQKARRPEFARK